MADSLLVEDVVISQNRFTLPLSQNARNIDIVTKEDIATLPVFNVSELLQFVSGLDIRRRGVNGVQSDAGIRGGTFNQVQILINGTKMNDPQTGHHMMNLPVSLADIERIEIIKGPAARIFGQNAYSGAINIITKVKKATAPSVNAHIAISSFETVQTEVGLTIPTAIGDHSLSLSHIGSEGYRYNTDYDITTLYYQSKIKGIGTGLDINAGYTDRAFGANGFYASEAFTEQYEEVTTSFVSATTLLSAGALTIRPRLSYRRNVDEYVFIRDNPSFFMNEHTGNAYNAELHFTYTSSYGISGWGVDVSRETLVSNNLGDRQRTIAGFFLEQRLSYMDGRLTVTPGLYANKITERDLKIYPGIDLGYQYSRSVQLFATANWSDRIPTYTNLYYTSRSELGNENLVAESATAVEAGVKWNTGNLSIATSIWHRDNKNLIDWAKDSINQEQWVALNFNQVLMTGLDLNTRYRWKDAVTQGRDIDLTLDYTYINAAISEDVDVAVSRYALDNLRHQVVAGLRTTLIPDYLQLSAHYRYQDRVSLEDYHLVDLKLMYRTAVFDAYLGVNNVTNHTYRETNLVPMPGRAFAVGVLFRG